jgi:hypothetical protein
MSLCVPEVSSKASLLDRGKGDVCDGDERCVPCINPLDGKPTGLCDIGKPPPPECSEGGGSGKPSPGSPGSGAGAQCPYTGPPLVDVGKFPSCGDGARCVPADLVPAAQQALLAKCPTGICAPEKAIAAGGNYVPETCTSIAGAEGRCANVVIPQVDAQKAMLPQATCDANERCAPCFSPLDGKETGACRTASCDAPKQPAIQLEGCCEQNGTLRGKCVPQSLVPASAQGKLRIDVCQAATEVCAPTALLDPTVKPVTCNGVGPIGPYTGVCVSTCVDFGAQGALMPQGSCAADHKCAPCAVLGQPTGAPGCPATP